MKAEPPPNSSKVQSKLARPALKRMLQVVVTYLLLAAILFLSSGQWGWVWAWAYIAMSLVILVINLVILPAELMAERGQPKENVKSWDKRISSITGLLSLGVPLVAGLDQRIGWSPSFDSWLQITGLALYGLGQGLFSWAMASNTYFSTLVRIQMDRGQTVASGGPYRWIRHPGYAGYIVFTGGMALALGSLWALIPTGFVAALLVLRTSMEDQTLQAELPGYKEYVARVRFRLLPGIW